MLASAPSVWLAGWYYFGRLREDGFRKHDVLLQSNDNFGRDFLGTLVFHQKQGATKIYGGRKDLQILIFRFPETAHVPNRLNRWSVGTFPSHAAGK